MALVNNGNSSTHFSLPFLSRFPSKFLSSFAQFCYKQIMIDAIIKAWLPSSPASTSADGDRPPQTSNPVLPTCYAVLADTVLSSKGRCRNLPTAMLALRMTAELAAQDSVLPSSVCTSLQSVLRYMEKVESLQMTQSSFSGKHTVIVMEGLCCSGKSMLASRLQQARPDLLLVDVKSTAFSNLTRELLRLPIVRERIGYLPALCDFLSSYVVASEVLCSSKSTVLVEEYYHAFVARHHSSEISPDEAANSPVFAWPTDLPLPELVLYLTCSSDYRLARQQSRPFSLNESRSEAIYALVRGPGTVGIESHLSIEDVHSTALQALDYFGIYSISRPCTAHPAAASVPDVMVPLDEAGSENEEPSNAMWDQWAWDQPVAPKHVINSRRSSIGVYGMYSKF